MSNNITISIDLAKDIFQLATFNRTGKALSNKKMKADKMRKVVNEYINATILMEACGSAHFSQSIGSPIDLQIVQTASVITSLLRKKKVRIIVTNILAFLLKEKTMGVW